MVTTSTSIFLWGQYDDEGISGVEAIKYFESLGLPNVGVHPRILNASEQEFYEWARLAGKPRVLGMTKYPVFVKLAFSCSSMFVDN